MTDAVAREIDEIQQAYVQNHPRFAAEPAAPFNVICQISFDKTGTGLGKPPGWVAIEICDG